MADCIFCEIVKGEKEAYKVYENDEIIAFLDVNPVSEGHTLIVSKQHYENIFEIPNGILEEIGSVSKKLAKKYKEKLGSEDFNILHASGEKAQQSVLHFHFHLVPRYSDDELDLCFMSNPIQI